MHKRKKYSRNETQGAGRGEIKDGLYITKGAERVSGADQQQQRREKACRPQGNCDVCMRRECKATLKEK